MASPDGVGWPEEPRGRSFGAAWDESRLVPAGLGWPRSKSGTGRPVPGAGAVVAGSGHHTAGLAPGVE